MQQAIRRALDRSAAGHCSRRDRNSNPGPSPDPPRIGPEPVRLLAGLSTDSQRRNDFKTGPADDARRAGAPATLATGGYGSGPAWAGRCSGASVANISRSSALTTFPPLLTGSSASLIQRVGTL